MLSVVIVTHDHRDAMAATLPALRKQLEEADELIVVDNASADDTAAAVRELAPEANVIETGANLGFAAACNRGASAANGELLCFLNPDAVAAEGWREAIAAPLSDGRDWAAWQALVTAEGGTIVNTSGGVVHFTGIAWAGEAGQELRLGAGWEEGDPQDVVGGARGDVAVPADPGFVSGACLAIPRLGFLDAGGFPEEFFLYHEDVDLSLRLRLGGGRLGVAGDARVDHDYDFEKGQAKWRHLERNRWATLLRTYPAPLLFLLGPALLATELALIPASIAGGWFGQKLRAWGDVLRWLPRLARERRAIQGRRRVNAAAFAAGLTAELDSAYLGAASRSGLLRAVLAGYWRVVLRLLGSPEVGPRV